MKHDVQPITDKRVALLVENGFEDGEFFGTLEGLRAAGAEVTVVGPTAPTEYQGIDGGVISSSLAAARARVQDFDAVVIPGGWAPGRIRMRHAMVDLVRDAAAAGKPVAAICHGPQVLISAKVVRDRKLTCWPSIAVDIKNAGGLYMDRPVVEDANIITSRKTDDVPQFTDAIVRALSGVSASSS